jgi:branched-chain amino acid transport system ATP-binding protein
MLEITDLHVSYGRVEAVRGFEASVRAGRITLVLGANGAGKTTSLRAVAGLRRAVKGSVRFKGEEMLGRAAHRIVAAGMTLVPEGRKIFAPLSVEENLKVGGHTASRASVATNLERVFAMFPVLKERRSAAGGLLSGGEQQMLAFGRALMSDPQAMLLDEPSMGLAPVVVDRVLASVRAIADSGIAVLMVEQSADAALAIADDVVVLARGEVVHAGPADAESPDAPVVRALLGDAAVHESARERP